MAAATDASWFRLTAAEWCRNWNGPDVMVVVIGAKVTPRSGQNGEKPLGNVVFELSSFGFDDSMFSMVKTDAEAAGELVDLGTPMVAVAADLYKSLELDAESAWNRNFFFRSSTATFFFI